MKKILLSVILAAGCLLAHAQIMVVNHTGSKLMVAIGYVEGDQHVAKGWVIMNNNESKALLPQLVPHRLYYYYAATEALTWAGNEAFLVGGGSFSTSLPKDKNNPGLQEKKFIKLNVSDGDETSCIIELKLLAGNIIVINKPAPPLGGVHAIGVD